MLGFFIAGSIDIVKFFQDEDPEKNWGDLLGGLSVTFVKVWAAGVLGVFAATALTIAAPTVPVVMVIVLGFGLTIVLEFGMTIFIGKNLDDFDNYLGISRMVKKGWRVVAAETSKMLDIIKPISYQQSSNVVFVEPTEQQPQGIAIKIDFSKLK